MIADERRPYPWPVRKALLVLLDLDPETTTREEYEKRWEERVVPLLNETPTQRFYRLVAQHQSETHLNREQAIAVMRLKHPRLFEAMHSASAQSGATATVGGFS